MTRYPLSAIEQAVTGFSHAWRILAADVAALGAATSGTIDLVTGMTAGMGVQAAAVRLLTAFSGGAISAFTLSLGTPANPTATTSILNALSIFTGANGAADAQGTAFAANRTGSYATGAATLQALFTSTTANLNATTAGELLLFVKFVDLNRIQGTL